MTGRPLPPIALAIALAALLCGVGTAGTTANRCAGGGRLRPDEGGIGGTGARPVAPGDDDGIGGTGIQARGETGLIGTITGFASICVAGAEVHYDADTPVRIDGRPATARDLAVGQVVELVADGSGAELHAREIAVRHIVAGPVTRADVERGEIAVVGQIVLLPPAPQPDGAGAFRLDTWVEVSGMRRGDGVVVASRVAPATPRDVVQLSGPLRAAGAGSLAIAGTTVEVAGESRPAPGDEVRVVGQWTGGAVRAETIDLLPRVPFDGRVSRVTIEGFASESAGGQLRVGAFPVDVTPGGMPDPLRSPDARVRVEGRIQDRQVVIDRLEPMDDLPVRPPRPGGDGRDRSGDGSDARGSRQEPPGAPARQEGAPPDDAGARPPSLPSRDTGPAERPARSESPARPDSVRPERPAERPERPADRPERPADRPERPPRFERPPR